MEKELTPDEVIEELGGCGKFQWRLNIVAHLMKFSACFGSMSIILTSATPNWWCSNTEHCINAVNTSTIRSNSTNMTTCPEKTCKMGNYSCDTFQFDNNMKTIVSEVRS